MLRLIFGLSLLLSFILGCTHHNSYSTISPTSNNTTNDSVTYNGEEKESYFDAGNRSMDVKDFNEAIENYTKEIEENPSNAQAYLNRAVAYAELGIIEKSKRDYIKACEMGIRDACTEVKFMKDESDPAVQLTYSLLDDATNLVPLLHNKMSQKDSLDEAMQGAEEFRRNNYSPVTLLVAKDYGAIAAFSISEIYGQDIKDFYIPQSVYFNGVSKIFDLQKELAKARKTIKLSKASERDRYNECLSLIVNLWISRTPSISKQEVKKIKEGVYLRDNDDKLYSYSEVAK